MKIKIKRLNDAVNMEAVNEDGNTITMDGSPAVGGINGGMRPMQLMLAGIGGCSAIDIVSILKKQKQDLKDISITVDGEREEGVAPALFTKIHVHYVLTGDLDENKVKRAVSLSMDKYCSVTRILEKTAQINYSFEIVNK